MERARAVVMENVIILTKEFVAVAGVKAKSAVNAINVLQKK